MGNLSFTGTFSKSPLAWGFEQDLTVERAEGCRVTLSDGREYIDWVSGLGSNLLGYGHPEIQEAVINEIQRGGGSQSLPHRLEYEVAELLAHKVGGAIGWDPEDTRVRFAKTGTDATTMAVRLARAVTENDIVITIKGGYHGWGEWSIGLTDPAHGIPPEVRALGLTKAVPFNDLEALEAAAQINIAAVIIEQGLEPPKDGYYEGVRRICDSAGALLIMDEIVTGLRYGIGGVCERYSIRPDLVCMGKALGNGFPISALMGHWEFMQGFSQVDPVFCSSTMWGESVGLAAAKAVLEIWKEDHVWVITARGEMLMDGLNAIGWLVIGDPQRSLTKFFSPEKEAFFIHGMREQGVLMNRPNFPTLLHTATETNVTIEAARIVWVKYQTALERGALGEAVEGKMPRKLFSNR